jgi:D-alanine-D-alanine ligase
MSGRRKKSVLIIHNAVNAGDAKDKSRLESIAGVLDEVKAVAAALEELGIEYQTKSIQKIEQLPIVLEQSSSRIVFNLVEDLSGSVTDACLVPAVCLAHKKACTGSTTPALLLSQNKWQAKAVLTVANVVCPAGVLVSVGQKVKLKSLPKGRYIVKPALADASEGIDSDSVVDVPRPALQRAVDKIHTQFGQPAIVEQFVSGREINVSLLERDGRVDVLPLAEIDFSKFGPDKPRIVGYRAKWLADSFEYQNTPRIIPAGISEKAADSIRQYAKKAWQAIGCNGYARVDFRLDENQQPFVLEVNPNPDISPDAGFPAAVSAAGITFCRFVQNVLDNAINDKLYPSRFVGTLSEVIDV